MITGYSDTLGSSQTKNLVIKHFCLQWQLVTVTLLPCPEGVAVTDWDCMHNSHVTCKMNFIWNGNGMHNFISGLLWQEGFSEVPPVSASCNFYSRTFIHFIRCTCQVKLLHAQESFIVYVTSFHVGETFCMHLGQVMSALWTRRLLQIKSGWTADLCTCHFLFTNTGLQYKVGPRFVEFCLQHSRNPGTALYWSPVLHSPSPKA